MTGMVSPRRIVTGESDRGSTVVDDGAATEFRSPVPGLVTSLLWATAGTADYRQSVADFPRPHGIAPPTGGSRFSILDIAPGHRSAAPHRTDTLDYVIGLAGEVDMLLDDGAVTLRPGDVAIQRGTMHGWHNRGPISARVAVILLDGYPKRTGSVAGGSEAP